MAIPSGKWPLRPYDPKCRQFVDPDPVIEGQIRCRIPLWSGDFDEVIPELTAAGVGLDELPLLTVKMIGQYVIRAAQGGSLVAGPIGTAAHTVTTAGPAVDTEAARLDEAEAKVRGHNEAGKLADFIVAARTAGAWGDGPKPIRELWGKVFDTQAIPGNTRPIVAWLQGAGIGDTEKGTGFKLTHIGKSLADRFIERRKPAVSRGIRVVNAG